MVSWCVSYSQSDTTTATDTNTYRIVKFDGGELVGSILKKDAREVLLLTEDGREVFIPQHTIKEIVVVNRNDFNSKGQFVGEDKFATRYFLTTNGLPIKKKEHYVQWNLFGPDFQFGIGENLGVGVMTTWVGIPIVVTVKKSWQVSDKTQLAVGALVGSGTWAAPEVGGALPFATLSFGNRSKNVAISGGYGLIWGSYDVSGRAMTSVAGMVKVSPKLSLIFDSFILLPGKTETVTVGTYTYEYDRPGFALLIPGIRWHQSEGKAFQFGFSGIIADGYVVPVPIPTVQWYRSL